MKIPFIHTLFQNRSTPPAPAPVAAANVPPVSESAPSAPTLENAAGAPANSSFVLPGAEASPYFRPGSITADQYAAAEAIRRENRATISRLKLDQARRAAAARELQEQQEAERRAKEEVERNRPMTWEEKFKSVADFSPTRFPVFYLDLLHQTGIKSKAESVVKKIKPLVVKFSALNDERRSIGPSAAAALVKNHLREQYAAADRGEEFVPGPDQKQLEEEFKMKRITLRKQMDAITAEVKPLVGKFAGLVQDAARERCEQLDKSERAVASALSIPFVPSKLLQVTAAAGFTAQKDIEIDNQLLPAIDTSEFLFGMVNKID